MSTDTLQALAPTEPCGLDVRTARTGAAELQHRPLTAAAGDYLDGMAFGDFLADVERTQPWLHALLDARWRDEAQVLPEVLALNDLSWEFEGQENGGRGVEYNRAQRNSGNRRIGMTQLLALFGADDGRVPGPETVILDVLAGDGTLRRFAERFGAARPEIVSADLSRLMVEGCRAQGYPCIRQTAVTSFFRESALDGVLIAYGSHHLGAEERQRAAAEAHRTIRPGGRFVLHDFESGGPVDAWFREAVDRYSITGHPYPHFSRDEMTSLLGGAGFRDVRVIEMEDPFTLTGETPNGARHAVLRHLHDMYGLTKLSLDDPQDRATLDDLARRTLGEITISPADSGFEARLERPALVAVGTR